MSQAMMDWILNKAEHNENWGPCYGLKYGWPNKEAHTCKCGLDDLRKRIELFQKKVV